MNAGLLAATKGHALSYTMMAAGLSVIGIWTSFSKTWPVWIGGQVLFALAITQWFAILHECGHKTFSGIRYLDIALGHLAGIFCLMPFETWRVVHHGHHLWTGWRDRDPTTRGIVPRPIGRYERMIFNSCWKWWIPVFSVAYRLTIFWNLSQLRRWYPRRQVSFAINILTLSVIYLVAGPWVLKHAGLALLLHLTVMDPILLSQHSHIPQKFAGNAVVRPMKTAEQDVFTRSVLFPPWISKWIFLGFDLHGLHHVYPQIPGYRLHRFNQMVGTTTSLGVWIKSAKRVPAHVLIFQNRDQSGIEI